MGVGGRFGTHRCVDGAGSMSEITARPPMLETASGTYRTTTKRHGVPSNGFWGDGPTRYRTLTSYERAPVHLSVEATPLAGSTLDGAMVQAAREQAQQTGRAVAIIEQADGSFVTRAAALKHRLYSPGGEPFAWADNLRRGTEATHLLMEDRGVRAIVNGADDVIIGARPYGVPIADAVFRATRYPAVGIGAATIAGVALFGNALAAGAEGDDRRSIRAATAAFAGASGLAGATLATAAIVGQGNPIHSPRWIGAGGAAMFAASIASFAMLGASAGDE